MAENKKDKEKNGKTEAAPRRLLRSRKDRMFWGVAGGLGEYLRIDPTLVRLGFAVSAFFGGFGVLAYLVMAVVVPSDDGTGQPSGRRPPTAAIVLLVLAALIALPGPFFGWGHGWHHGWWAFFGPLWVAFVVVTVIVILRTLRGRPPRWLRGTRTGTGEPSADAQTHETEERGEEPPRWLRAIALILLGLAAVGAALAVAAAAAWVTATGH